MYYSFASNLPRKSCMVFKKKAHYSIYAIFSGRACVYEGSRINFLF